MKIMIRILSIVLLSILHLAQVQAQEQVQVQEHAWKQFKEAEGNQWRVRWDTKSRYPKMIYGGLSKVYHENPSLAARAFLEEKTKLFGMHPDLNDLHVVSTTTNKFGVSRIRFQQYYNALLVEGAQFIVHVNEQGQVMMFNGSYYPEINLLSESGSISSEAATAIAIDHSEFKDTEVDAKTPYLVVHKNEEGHYAYAWKTHLFSEEPFYNKTYLIHADNGEIIAVHDGNTYIRTNFLEQKAKNDFRNEYVVQSQVSGIGNVFLTHPILDNYTTTQVTLERLWDTGYLEGTYAKVFNDDGIEAYRMAYDFDEYDTTSTHFDEVNAYYHVDKIRTDFFDLLDNLSFNQIHIHTHAVRSGDDIFGQWFYDAGLQKQVIKVGDANSNPNYNNLAWEDKVLYHEYSHGVFNEFHPPSGSPNEYGAISEGIADYFAGAYTERPKIFDYVDPVVGNLYRDMSNPDSNWDTYSDYESQQVKFAHKGGEFFSSILWDIRQNSGGNEDDIDFIVYDALAGLVGEPTFIDFMELLLNSDAANYSGAYKSLILDKFANKGVIASFGGSISSNTTWNAPSNTNEVESHMVLTDNITIQSSAKLTIYPNTTIYIPTGKSIKIYGELDANGVDFIPLNTHWNGITFNNGSDGEIENCTITGVNSYGGAAIRIYTNNHLEIHGNTITEITGAASGISLSNASDVNIYENHIENTSSHGIYAYNSNVNAFNNFIKNPASAGVFSTGYSNVLFSAATSPNYEGENTISGGKYGLQISGSATLNAGTSSTFASQNRIANQSGSGWAHIYSTSYYTNYAKYNYYGGTAAIKGGWGPVNYSPHLTNDPDPGIGFKRVSVDHEPLIFVSSDEEKLYSALELKIQENFEGSFSILEALVLNSDSDIIVDQSLNEMAWVIIRSGDADLFRRFVYLAKKLQGTVYEFDYLVAKTRIFYSKLKFDEALNTIQLALSSSDLDHGKYKDAIILASHIAADFGDRELAIKYLDQASSFKTKSQEDDIFLELINYIESKDKGSNKFETESNELDKTDIIQLFNYPNPFNPSTNISFNLTNDGPVELVVFDLLGRKVAELVNEFKTKGSYSVFFDASSLSSGIYLYQLKVDNQVITKQMTLIK